MLQGDVQRIWLFGGSAGQADLALDAGKAGLDALDLGGLKEGHADDGGLDSVKLFEAFPDLLAELAAFAPTNQLTPFRQHHRSGPQNGLAPEMPPPEVMGGSPKARMSGRHACHVSFNVSA